jgi:hypothetical protein
MKEVFIVLGGFALLLFLVAMCGSRIQADAEAEVQQDAQHKRSAVK